MKKTFKDLRTYFIGIYAILNLGAIAQMFIAKMIPMKYKLIVTVILLILFFVCIIYNMEINLIISIVF